MKLATSRYIQAKDFKAFKVAWQPFSGKKIKLTNTADKLLRFFENGRSFKEFMADHDDKDRPLLAYIAGELMSRGFLLPADENELWHLQECFYSHPARINFLNSTFRSIKKIEPKTICILGVPYDGGGKHPGARFGPNVIREQSLHYTFRGSGRSCYDIDKQKTYNMQKAICDCGNVEFSAHMNQEIYYNQVEKAANEIVNRGGIPIVLGGDHSITLPIIKAVAKERKIVVAQFDAHLDYEFSRVLPSSHNVNHSNVMSYIKNIANVIQLFQYGIRRFQSVPLDMDLSWVKNGNVFSDFFLNTSSTIDKCLPKGQNIYITIDIDVLSPAMARSTGYPSFWGLEFKKMIQMLNELMLHNHVLGIDLTEASERKTADDRTHEIACLILINCICNLIEKMQNSNNNDDATIKNGD